MKNTMTTRNRDMADPQSREHNAAPPGEGEAVDEGEAQPSAVSSYQASPSAPSPPAIASGFDEPRE